jgi:phosphoribosylformimino-5-aminoimidazole carboxamide ribotide isomerase
MQIFPAIDLRHGQAVRLFQGDYDQMTVFSHSPADVAKSFADQGATNLHCVDLDGAKDGRPVNSEVIARLLQQGLYTQVGGGIRDHARVDYYLSLGVGRVILGTAALENFPFVEEMVKLYGERIAVGVDARDGMVATHGWLTTSDVPSFDFCRRLRDAGVKTVIYTDISRDGGMAGANLEVYRQLGELKGLDIVASGGVSFYSDVQALYDMGIYGAIVGKALYTGALELPRLLDIASGKETVR